MVNPPADGHPSWY